MNKEKKEELAELDPRWNFEKTVEIPQKGRGQIHFDWEYVRDLFNNIQEKDGSLYMVVSKLPLPTRRKKAKLWLKNKTSNHTNPQQVTIHHEQIYDWFQRLGNHLDITVGEAISEVVYKRDKVKEELPMDKSMKVKFTDVQMQESDSEVSKDELMDMIEDEQDNDMEDAGVEADNENLDTHVDNTMPERQDESDDSN